MRFCLTTIFACAALALPGLAATVARPPRAVAGIRSVVRAGANGKLVRTVVVVPKIVAPRLIEASDVAEPRPAQAAFPAENLDIPEFVEATARKYAVDPLLVHSVIQVESAYNPRAVSIKGAQGLMQLMPGTARRFGVSNSFDPRENIEGGVRYLKYLTGLFPEDLRLAIAAYNAGEGAVWKYNNRIPPYPETEQYVYLVGRKYGQALRDANRKKEAVQQASATAIAASSPQQPVGPVYAPVRYVYDANGGLQLLNDQTP
ncbi:MAG: lytic transglycosylase domain-containing protein [Bryobacteraceae bacterium]|nr:lytic transglycosylase domain-containing protein [Bryobacteraceae bacterium]